MCSRCVRPSCGSSLSICAVIRSMPGALRGFKILISCFSVFKEIAGRFFRGCMGFASSCRTYKANSPTRLYCGLAGISNAVALTAGNLWIWKSCNHYDGGGPGSSVGIATNYGLDGPGMESRWGRDFPPVQIGPGAHPASCTMGTRSFLGVNCGRGVLLTNHPLLAPRSWKSRAIPLPPSGPQPGL